MLNPNSNYLEKEVLQASPIDQILLLYNKALTSLKMVKSVIEKPSLTPEEVKIKAEALSKAVDILIYLKAVLDHEKGGQVAKNLDEIYGILIEELVRFNFSNDTKVLNDTIEILDNMKKAWQDIRGGITFQRPIGKAQTKAF
ncbi:MAG: flagellar export chaperone FliS [Caldimicrobium sp.]|nr:flagellar export chaperone FliS [Caldimicrobium sp.]MCX7613731.1 flagellar export chaperone FliS [Caldimicrobium sp.]MDW8183170.1 flagellar export chaperone FliS [Caldimicrobium sp.]